MEKILTLKELQKLNYDNLKIFADFCEENNLLYFLGGGTLLGAIRHQECIPWDDDIDINMPRPDYMKLIHLAKDGIGEHLQLNTRYLDPQCPSSIIRVYDTRTEITFDNFTVPWKIGAWIDIFPFDGLPSNKLQRKIHFKKMRLAMDLYIISVTKFGGKRRSKITTILQYAAFPLWPITRMIGYNRILSYIDRLARKYNIYESGEFACLEGRAEEKEAMPREQYLQKVKVKFGEYDFNAPSCYDFYLKCLYGDYMKLPPETERVSRHEIKIKWKGNK